MVISRLSAISSSAGMRPDSLSFGRMTDSHSTRLIRAARYAAYGVGALVVLAVAAALALPAFVDMPAIEKDLQAKLSQAVHGEIAWEKLTLRVLPSPRGSFGRVRAEIPGVASVRAEQVDAHLRLLP